MDTKTVVYGENLIDELVQWLKSTGEPQDLKIIVEQYLEILRKFVLEEQQ